MTIFSKPLMKQAFNAARRNPRRMGIEAGTGALAGAAIGATGLLGEDIGAGTGAMIGGIAAGGAALNSIMKGRALKADYLRSYRKKGPGGKQMAKTFRGIMS